MTTNKPRVVGYIDRSIWEAFQSFQTEAGMSQSQALQTLISKALGISTDQVLIEPEIAPSRIDQLEETIQAQYINVLQQVDELRIRLESLEKVPLLFNTPGAKSLLNGDTLSDASGELPIVEGDTSGELPTAEGDTSGELPTAEGDTSGELPIVEGDTSGELPIVEGNTSGELPIVEGNTSGRIPVAGGNTPGDALSDPHTGPYIISRRSTIPPSKPDAYQYWTGRQHGFSFVLKSATHYKTQRMVRKELEKIKQSDIHYPPDRGWEIQYKPISFFENIEEQKKLVSI